MEWLIPGLEDHPGEIDFGNGPREPALQTSSSSGPCRMIRASEPSGSPDRAMPRTGRAWRSRGGPLRTRWHRSARCWYGAAGPGSAARDRNVAAGSGWDTAPQGLDCDATAKRFLDGLIDFAHPSVGDRSDHAVGAEPLRRGRGVLTFRIQLGATGFRGPKHGHRFGELAEVLRQLRESPAVVPEDGLRVEVSSNSCSNCARGCGKELSGSEKDLITAGLPREAGKRGE